MEKNTEVDRWFRDKKPKGEPAMQRVRETILGADERMTERVQYGTITFACKDNMASFVQVANKHVTLMFNRGQLIHDKAKHPHLEGAGPIARRATGEILMGQPADVNSIAEPRKVAPRPVTINDAGPRFVHEFPAGANRLAWISGLPRRPAPARRSPTRAPFDPLGSAGAPPPRAAPRAHADRG